MLIIEEMDQDMVAHLKQLCRWWVDCKVKHNITDKTKAWNSNKFKEIISEILRLSAYSLTISNDCAPSRANILDMPQETVCKQADILLTF